MIPSFMGLSTDQGKGQQGQSQHYLSIEWQYLTKLFQSRSALALLNDLSDVISVLKDTKSEQWQRRAESMDQIKNILFNTAEFIQTDPGIIEAAKTNCPMVLGQHQADAGRGRQLGELGEVDDSQLEMNMRKLI